MRWEKERALPVHRGSSGKSGVVFADKDELDAWMRGESRALAAAEDVGEVPVPPVPPRRQLRTAAAAAAVLAAALGLLGWRLRVFIDDSGGTIEMTDQAVLARHADGSEKWRHDFGAERAGPMYGRGMNTVERLGSEGVLAAFSEATRTDPPGIRSGQLLWFDPAGTITRTFAFDDRLAFASRAFSAPWSISDYQLERTETPRRIAVSAHHQVWWPSIITVLDDRWQRKGSFVHAGWVEHLRWMSARRLAMAGFSNLNDGGMVALLDADRLDGQSPAPQDSAFHCTGCGPDRPVRYIVLPRSEVNRVSGAPFNRAAFAVGSGTLVVYTVELPQTPTGTPANAFYEFTPQLELVDASYGDRYWEAHQELERLRKIAHTRDQCPERDGPREIRVWERETGWTIVPAAPLRARARSAIER
jgi:hypothetical protein